MTYVKFQSHIYIARNGKLCYFDPVTKCLRIKTPEEEVRQKLLVYLLDELEVPCSAIGVEIPLAHYCKGVRGRADVVIFSENSDNENAVPVAVIECKASSVSVVDSVHEQVLYYAQHLEVGLIGITNGFSLDFAYLDRNTEKFSMIKELPKYENMCNYSSLNLVPIVESVRDKYNFTDITHREAFVEAQNDGYIGEDTPVAFSHALMNLLVGLLYTEPDTKYSLDIGEYEYVKDLGIRYANFGNASGGSYAGDYRSFMFMDDLGNSQIVSLSLFSTLKTVDDPKWGTRRGYTSLIVAMDDFDKHHNALQLNMDDFMRITGSCVEICHNGKITVGKKGAAKPSELIEFLRQSDDTLLRGDKVYLGTLDFSKPMSMEVEAFRKFLERVILYAFLRDAFRYR